MADSPPVDQPNRSAGFALLAASCGLIVLQAWNIIAWSRAVDRGQTQAERVDLYLHTLPLGVGRLGTSGLTWFAFLCAVVSLVASLAAGRLLGRSSRFAIVGLVTVNSLLMIWYLFTLM